MKTNVPATTSAHGPKRKPEKNNFVKQKSHTFGTHTVSQSWRTDMKKDEQNKLEDYLVIASKTQLKTKNLQRIPNFTGAGGDGDASAAVIYFLPPLPFCSSLQVLLAFHVEENRGILQHLWMQSYAMYSTISHNGRLAHRGRSFFLTNFNSLQALASFSPLQASGGTEEISKFYRTNEILSYKLYFMNSNAYLTRKKKFVV